MIRPMLARKADEVPAGRWTFEVKWDGVRCVALVQDGQVTMQSRSGKSDYALRFGHVALELEELPDCVLDGELVTFDGNGRTFGLARGVGPAAYVIFDVIEYEGQSMRWMRIEQRRTLLAGVLQHAQGRSVTQSPVFKDGEALMAHVMENGLEGIVAKRDRSGYEDGKRSPAWLKVKVRPEQEFVVCGWTDGKGARVGTVGGLVLGYWAAGELHYAGRVGCRTDMNAAVRAAMRPTERCPFGKVPKEERDAHWLMPELVVQVAFQRWTDDGRLWHPICRGLRGDKLASDVTKEV